MPSEILRPNAPGDECNVDYAKDHPCPNHYMEVDEVSPDEWSSYISNNDGVNVWQRDLYNIPNGSGIGIITKIKLYFRVCNFYGTSGIAKGAIKTGGTAYETPVQTAGEGWTTKSYEWAINPKTESAWTWSDINALQIGVALWGGSQAHTGIRGECTQVYVEVYYAPLAAPTVTTQAADSIEQTTANPKGNVANTGGENPTRYIDYDTDSGTPYANSKDCGVGGVGVYNSNLTGLTPDTKYYYRARAVNSGGTGTGDEMTFTTKPIRSAQMAAKMVAAGVL